jgi:hypothetical protein
VGFLYYSGHGIASAGENYLIPTDVDEPSTVQLSVQGVKQSEVLAILRGEAPNAAHYLVLDACRNTLQGARGGKGFVLVGQQSGVLVAFATEPGKTASDIGQGSGPYAAALAAELVKPAQNDLLMFHNVRVAVMDKTNGDQVPWTEDGIQRRQRVLFGGEVKGTPLPQSAPPTPVRLSEAAQAWDRAKDATSIGLLETFIAHFKETFYADLAQTRIQELRAKEPKVDVDLSAGSALQDSLEGIGLKGDVIASDAGIPIAKCWDDCSANQSCVAAEHDQEFSRCNLYSRVEEKIRSPRFTSFVRSNRGVKLDQRVQLFANTALQGEVIESTPYLSKDDCRSACIENKGCVAAEHDEAFSRCTLFSNVARSIKSPRYTTFLIDGYILK